MSNIYYNPEDFGLEIVAQIEYSDSCYQFDTRVVWKVKGKKIFYTMRDSGCSCPTPFEDYNLSNIEKMSLVSLRIEVNSELSNEYKNITPEQAQEFLYKVRSAR